MSSAALLPASFAILLAAALLFTNAIEWFGSMRSLGQGAVRSVLAAVALVAAYVLYVMWTLRHGGPVEAEEKLKPLIMRPRDRPLNCVLRELLRVRRRRGVTPPTRP